jgi:Chalcone isomerase-like
MKQYTKYLSALLVTGSLTLASVAALAVEVAGVKMEEVSKLGNTELKLNGAGVRTKVVFKVYVAGLYLPEKKNTVADILAVTGPRRMMLVMMRDIDANDFGQSFTTGLNDNVDAAEKKKIVDQTAQFGQMFANLPSVKKGDVLLVDWVPGVGTVSSLNGKKLGEAIPDIAFYNAVLKIWLGDKPVDKSLKPLLIGEVSK